MVTFWQILSKSVAIKVASIDWNRDVDEKLSGQIEEDVRIVNEGKEKLSLSKVSLRWWSLHKI